MQSGQQYLRARFYDPASGTFNRLDPFAGNLADPQSLHKYLYAHGNPVAFGDPSGHFAEPLLMAGQSGGTTSWVRIMTSGVIGAVFARGEEFVRTLYLTGDINAAEDAAADAAATGFAMGIAMGMLEGRLTPYLGVAAFGFGLAQAKQEWQAGHHALATVDFTLAVFSFFTGVYKPMAAQVRSKAILRDPIDWSIVKKSTGETRWQHIQKHGTNNTNKPTHGVFNNDPVLTTQEAWYRGQRLGIQLSPDGTLVVPMGRPVGWQGGVQGTGAALDNVTIITTDGTQIITAFPS